MKSIKTLAVLISIGAIHAGCGSRQQPPEAGRQTGTSVAQFRAFDTPCLSAADPDVAPGPDLIGVAIQWNAYFYNKTTGLLDHTFTWKAFKGKLISDTHIIYDRSSQRWFITTAVRLGASQTGVQIMVSTDATAREWRYSVPIETLHIIDNPQPTVTSDKVVITESAKCIWAVDKMALIAGNAAVVQPLTCDVARNNQVVAVKYGGDPPARAYAIVMSDSTHLNWISTEGPAATARVVQHSILVPVVDEVDRIIQAGKLDLQSSSNKAMWQNDHLVWTRTVHCPTGTCIRSFDINTATNTVKSDDFAIEGTQLFNGASGLGSAGNMWLLCSAAKPEGFVGLALGGRSASGQVLSPTKIVEGQSMIDWPAEDSFFGLITTRYPEADGRPIRFGDYVAAAQDPVDGTVWLIGLYAATRGPFNRESAAGCKVVHVMSN